MLITTKTPLRISLVGGGSDLPSFYKKEPGAVVSFTINKFVYVHVMPRFMCDSSIRASYSKTEIVEHVNDLKHELIRECLIRMGITNGIEVVSISNVPGKGSGLGSSGAYVVGLLNALNQYRLLYNHDDFEPIRVDDLEEEACAIEMIRCGKPGGKQDQYAVANGGINHIVFEKNGDVHVTRLNMCGENVRLLEDHMMLFYTGITRSSSEILEEQSERTVSDEKVFETLMKMKGLANVMADTLEAGDMQYAGELLCDNWELKKTISSKISNPDIDKWYETAMNAGAIGGKLCGAGGGGFLLFLVPPDAQEAVLKALPLCHVPIRVEHRGTRLIYMEGFND